MLLGTSIYKELDKRILADSIVIRQILANSPIKGTLSRGNLVIDILAFAITLLIFLSSLEIPRYKREFIYFIISKLYLLYKSALIVYSNYTLRTFTLPLKLLRPSINVINAAFQCFFIYNNSFQIKELQRISIESITEVAYFSYPIQLVPLTELSLFKMIRKDYLALSRSAPLANLTLLALGYAETCADILDNENELFEEESVQEATTELFGSQRSPKALLKA